jgi:hypothetical protein
MAALLMAYCLRYSFIGTYIFASVSEFKEVIVLKRIMMWSNLLLGLWLMLSPFVLAFLNQAVFKVLWEDLILGFGIATFSLSAAFCLAGVRKSRLRIGLSQRLGFSHL